MFNSPFSIPHSSFLIPHSSFPITPYGRDFCFAQHNSIAFGSRTAGSSRAWSCLRLSQKFPIPHSPFLIPHSSFLIPHSSFLIPQSSFPIPHSSFLIPHYTLLPMVVIFASLSIILSPSAQGPLVQAELGSAFAYRKNSSFHIL